MNKEYYKQVELYYDDDAQDFDKRYWQNPVLQRIRQDFREQVKRFRFFNMLEIGFGTGIDLLHFSKTHPDANIHGIDVSSAMHKLANERIINENLKNVSALRGNIEDIESLFPNRKFDMIYVFFGALNTVDNLEKAANDLINASEPGGMLVLSFVNKYYLTGILIELMKFRFNSAFSRLKPIWGGYSPSKHLPSRCYSISEIQKTFHHFHLIHKRGYCIMHPAWYYLRINKLLGNRGRRLLWNIDTILNRTFLWRFGEYSLFVFQKPGDIHQNFP